MAKYTSEQRLEAAKYRMALDDKSMWYTFVLHNTEIKLTKIPQIKTAAACVMRDKISIEFAEEYLAKLSIEQIIGVLCHEILHIISLHMTKRLHGRNKAIWNFATDMEINTVLKDNAFSLPLDCLYPEKHNFPERQTAEFYYAELLKKVDKKKQSSQSGAGSGGGGGGSGGSSSGKSSGKGSGKSKGGADGTDKSKDKDKQEQPDKSPKKQDGDKEQEKKEEQQNQQNQDTSQHGGDKETEDICSGGTSSIDQHDKWENNKPNQCSQSNEAAQQQENMIKSIVKSATDSFKQACKNRGTLPAYLASLLETMFKPAKVDWRQVIRANVQASIKCNKIRSFKRTNRRFGDTVKGSVATRIAKIIIAKDTSGSVSVKDHENFINEIEDIKNQYPVELRIIDCDAEIAHDQVYKKGQKIPKKIYGGGGTDFIPVFNYIKKKKYNPNLLVYFTDSYGQFPTKAPGYKVIWAYSSKGNKERVAPFGLEVYVDDEEDTKDN